MFKEKYRIVEITNYENKSYYIVQFRCWFEWIALSRQYDSLSEAQNRVERMLFKNKIKVISYHP